jgi:hypothetical protein
VEADQLMQSLSGESADWRAGWWGGRDLAEMVSHVAKDVVLVLEGRQLIRLQRDGQRLRHISAREESEGDRKGGGGGGGGEGGAPSAAARGRACR